MKNELLYRPSAGYEAFVKKKKPSRGEEGSWYRFAWIKVLPLLYFGIVGKDQGNLMGDKHTPRQGQYLAFIYYYTKIHGYAPSEADMEGYFKVAWSSIHQMILTLEERGLIERTPGKGRSIRLLLPREELPDLKWTLLTGYISRRKQYKQKWHRTQRRLFSFMILRHVLVMLQW